MNLRMFTIAMLVSAIPMCAMAESAGITLNKGDFISAKQISRNGGTLISTKLSKSGRAKFKKLNQHSVGQAVHAEIDGVSSDFTLRDTIHGNGLEMGPFSPDEAQKVSTAINRK
jgi:hypothetical protein